MGGIPVTLIFVTKATPGAFPTPKVLELGPLIIQLDVKSPVVLGEIMVTERSIVSPGFTVSVNGTDEGALNELPLVKLREYAVVQLQEPVFLMRHVLMKL